MLIPSSRSFCLVRATVLLFALSVAPPSLAFDLPPPLQVREQSVPILGVTTDPDQRPMGIVVYVMIHFEKRVDHDGLKVHFRKVPGRFGPLARIGVATAIGRAAKAAHLEVDSWTVILTFPYSGLTLYGDSLSGMVALSVLALANGDAIKYGRTLSGTITEDGLIGQVTGIPYKVYAAHAARLDRVLIPEDYHPLDGDWQIPFLMDVAYVGTLEKAYFELTDQPLFR